MNKRRAVSPPGGRPTGNIDHRNIDWTVARIRAAYGARLDKNHTRPRGGARAQ